MLAEWSVECSAESPVLVIPWNDPDGNAKFVDLRADRYNFDAIPEAEQHPPLMQALRALNAPRSPVFTAKCDAWALSEEELSQLLMEIDLPAMEAQAGFGSYIDLVLRERSQFTSFPQHEQIMRRLTRMALPLDVPWAMLECVLRPALLDLDGPQEGFALSLYVKATGVSEQDAVDGWKCALEAVVALLRSKEFSR